MLRHGRGAFGQHGPDCSSTNRRRGLSAKHPLSRFVLLWATLLALCGTAPLAIAQDVCLTPSDDVDSALALRASASISATQTGRLLPDEIAVLVGEVPGWYRITLTSGKTGFVSQTWARIIGCEPQDASAGSFEIHAIDVGTGLSIFARGDDFSLLYDAGSNDDVGKGEKNRVVAYLDETFPELERIDHVILSHPHRDHVELLADVFTKYEVGDVWDSGALHTICGYRAFINAASREPGARYHTALRNYGTGTIEFENGCSAGAQAFALRSGARIDAEPMTLGEDAWMQFLYVDGSKHGDLNDNSLVLRLNLGGHTVLLAGDSGGGDRRPPGVAPSAKSIEAILLACCKTELEADVLVAGHHGSMTSSRSAFLDAVKATVFLVSSGPFKYSGTMLPDDAVIAELESRGDVWRTDVDDAACALSPEKTGKDDDGKAGGCNNIRVRLSPSGIQTNYQPAP